MRDKKIATLGAANAQAFREANNSVDAQALQRYLERVLLNVYNTLIDTSVDQAETIDPKVLRSLNQVINTILTVQTTKTDADT